MALNRQDWAAMSTYCPFPSIPRYIRAVTIDPAGYFVLVCPDKIASAPWSWKGGKLTFHTRSEDPVLSNLGRSWKVMKNNGRLHLKSTDNSVEAVLKPTAEG